MSQVFGARFKRGTFDDTFPLPIPDNPFFEYFVPYQTTPSSNTSRRSCFISLYNACNSFRSCFFNIHTPSLSKKTLCIHWEKALCKPITVTFPFYLYPFDRNKAIDRSLIEEPYSAASRSSSSKGSIAKILSCFSSIICLSNFSIKFG